ncbi:hypothetical protein B7P43_G01001 [Cryptotermes secundus]|uniref:Uncharacterized protein n=2 Tax=Cryptotermes secundus TaxID=105785 RepID=A0A2J7PG55_9NEOP|nr:hypothetical protein B7P43_G01001 [Cryptotermes secundus]
MQEKQQNKEMGPKTEEVLAIEKQAVEEIQTGCGCSKDQAIQEMRELNRHLIELEKMLAAERNNMVHLHEIRALLSAQMHATKCGLMEERVSKDSLSHKTARLNHLKARLSYSRAHYRSQLADARHMLGSRNAKVNQLRSALVKVKDLCHSIDSSYRTMLSEIGNQVQLIAEMVARNYHLEWSQGPIVAIPTAADLKEWYQHIWHTTRWIQLHIPLHQLCVQQSSLAEVNQHSRTSSAHPNLTSLPLYDVKTDTSSPHIADNSSDFSFDLELRLDMSNTMQPTAICSTDLDSTTCSSLSQDLSWQHEATQDRHQMQHRFLTILDNLKEKLLQLKPSSIH